MPFAIPLFRRSPTTCDAFATTQDAPDIVSNLRNKIAIIGKRHSLSIDRALKNAEKVRDEWPLPTGASWWAIPDDEALLHRRQERVIQGRKQRYCAAVKIALEILEGKLGLCNRRQYALQTGFWQLDLRTENALRRLRETQKAEVLIVGGWLGTKYAGSPVIDVHRKMMGGEFGGHSIAAAAILHTNINFFVEADRKSLLLLGERCGATSRAHLEEVPLLKRTEGELELDGAKEHRAVRDAGSLILFLPNEGMKPYLV